MSMTAEELREKIDWEGGVWGALQYGITSHDIEDHELARRWAELERAFAVAEEIWRPISVEIGY